RRGYVYVSTVGSCSSEGERESTQLRRNLQTESCRIIQPLCSSSYCCKQ
ncbi:unnamed protein product, partial [Arabidopsis halleri]